MLGGAEIDVREMHRNMALTLFDKIWNDHLVAVRPDGRALVYMDRTMLDEVRAPHVFARIEQRGLAVRRPDLTFVVQDHSVATAPGRTETTRADSAEIILATRASSHRHGVRLFDLHDPEQGISHVIAPELGMVLPGGTHACADSHAATVGALGALAFGCGSTELEHILTTQTMALARPATMRLMLHGRLDPVVTAKDVILHVIGRLGVDGAAGHAVELAGPALTAIPVEGRFTLCNMCTELGARTALAAPDDAVFEWLHGRPMVPAGAAWDVALAGWRGLRSDDEARFDTEIDIDCTGLEPQVTWGTDPSQTIGISEAVPDLAAAPPGREAAWRRALAYAALPSGKPITGTPITRAFIGSCTNARLSDLQAAAAVIRGRKVAEGVQAVVVPGSMTVRRQAEALGLDQTFKAAGFEWHESGCAMCAGGSGARANPGERIMSTTNRNFEGRQGRDVRTHLASPAMVVAAAIAGRIVDVRHLVAGEA